MELVNGGGLSCRDGVDEVVECRSRPVHVKPSQVKSSQVLVLASEVQLLNQPCRLVP